MGTFNIEFLEVLLLVAPTLREACPALFEILQIHDLHSPFPKDWNELMIEIHE